MRQFDLQTAQAEVTRFTIPADASLVAPLRQRFIDTLSTGGMRDADLDQWKLVFSELVFNAIFHGADQDSTRSITVEWSLMEDAVMLASQDPGIGPPDKALNSPSLPEDPTAESGRGLFIISSFADTLRPWRGAHGFRLEIIKNYPGLGRLFSIDPEMARTLDELSSCYESLSVFNRLAENLIESRNLRRFIDDSLTDFLTLHPQDRIFFQGSPDIPNDIRTVLANAPWFLDPEDADEGFRSLGALARETIWESREDLIRHQLDFPSLHSAAGGCVFPIVAGEIHFGALVVLRKPSANAVQFRSLDSLRALADLCGIACANAHLSSIREESLRDLRELEIAVGIQKALLPILPAPASPNWSVSIKQDSSLHIAGDYAMARLDDQGNLVVAMIDVMGKGVSAALLASIFKTSFGLVINIPSADGILHAINQTLCEQLGNLTMFITCAIARVSADGSALDHASAGHCPTFFYRADGSRFFLEPSGPPLGIIPDTVYQNDRYELRGGERLVFITDGCYEWDRQDESHGWATFVDFIDTKRSASPCELWSDLRSRIKERCGSHLEDDCTLLTLDIPS